MKHGVKTFAFKSLAILPSSIGVWLYHFLQNFSENKNLDTKINSTENTYNTLLRMCKELGISLENRTVVEIGSGWLPLIPYFLRFKSNVAKVHTYDLNAHYQKKNVEKVNTAFKQKYGFIIEPSTKNKYGLPEHIAYHPSENLVQADLPDAQIIFSRFVLEHVTPADMFNMHVKFGQELRKGTYIIHFISPSDHRAYSDKSLSLQDFLKYSPQEWDGIQTTFDYHNRMRLPQYLELFKQCGLELVHVTYDNPEPGSTALDKFRELKIHGDYSRFSEEELTAGSINVILKV